MMRRNLTPLGEAVLILALFGLCLCARLAMGQTVVTTAIKNPQGIRKCGSAFYIADAQGKGVFSSGGVYKYDPATGVVTSIVGGFNVVGKVDCVPGNTGVVFDSPYGQVWRHDFGTSGATLLAAFAGNNIPAWQVASTGGTTATVGMMGSQRLWSFGLFSPTTPVAVAGNGNYTTAGGDGPALTIPLGQPGGVALGPDGATYFGEQAGGHIRRLKLGNIETLSGTGFAGWCDPGSMTFGDCSWQAPTDLRFVGNDLYVLDATNLAQFRVVDVVTKGRAAKIDLMGVFTSLGRPGGQEIDGGARYVTFPDSGVVVRFGDGPAVPTATAVIPATATPTITQAAPTSVPTQTPTKTAVPPVATPTASAVATATNTAGVPACVVPCRIPNGSVLQ